VSEVLNLLRNWVYDVLPENASLEQFYCTYEMRQSNNQIYDIFDPKYSVTRMLDKYELLILLIFWE